MTPETLARLTAQAPSLILGVGGKAELTKAELAAALCKVHPEAQALAFYRYVGDESVMPKLQYQAWLQSVDVFAKNGWRNYKDKHGPLTRKFGLMALYETLHRQPCKGCGGSRYEPTGQWCEICDGSGFSRDPVNDRMRAMAIEMAYTTWVSTWRSRYVLVRAHIGQWVSEKDSQIWEGLRRQ